MLIEVRSQGGTFTADLPAVPAEGEQITRYDGATETILEVTGRRKWVLDKDAAPLVIIRATVLEHGTSVQAVDNL